MSSCVPLIALVGRPNVGKSSLFNRLLSKNIALVSSEAGLTRDRHYALFSSQNTQCMLVDTGGLMYSELSQVHKLVNEQTLFSIDEADHVFFVCCARSGYTSDDRQILDYLRQKSIPFTFIVNKIDGLSESEYFEFYNFHSSPYFVSATHARGISYLISVIASQKTAISREGLGYTSPIITILGRPNVGKSTFMNALLGEERVLASEIAGLTRDAIYAPSTFKGLPYTVVDTAGIRRKSKVEKYVERDTVISAFSAARRSDVVLLMLDAHQGLVLQDMHLLRLVVDLGKAVIILINKSDLLTPSEAQNKIDDIQCRLSFAPWIPVLLISAQKKLGLSRCMKQVFSIYEASDRSFSSSQLNALLEEALVRNPPPMVRRRRIKLKFVHLLSNKPLKLVVHGNQVKDLPEHYIRFLRHFFQNKLKLFGIPVQLSFKQSNNPYAHKPNKLNARQMQRRSRLIAHRKRSKK